MRRNASNKQRRIICSQRPSETRQQNPQRKFATAAEVNTTLHASLEGHPICKIPPVLKNNCSLFEDESSRLGFLLTTNLATIQKPTLNCRSTKNKTQVRPGPAPVGPISAHALTPPSAPTRNSPFPSKKLSPLPPRIGGSHSLLHGRLSAAGWLASAERGRLKLVLRLPRLLLVACLLSQELLLLLRFLLRSRRRPERQGARTTLMRAAQTAAYRVPARS